MAWTLLLMLTPSATTSGTGQITELSLASGVQMTYSVDARHQLSFTVPHEHWQSALIKELRTDILAFRDSSAVMRFRVTGVVDSESGDELSTSVTALSYGCLWDRRLFRSGDKRTWSTGTNQSQVAWDVIANQQLKYAGDLGVDRGLIPSPDYNRALSSSQELAAVGSSVREFLDSMASFRETDTTVPNYNYSGFDYDFVPSRASGGNQFTRLMFDVWAHQPGRDIARQSNPSEPPFVLDRGGALASWSRTTDLTSYANSVYALGVQVSGAVRTPYNQWAPAAPPATSPGDPLAPTSSDPDVGQVAGQPPVEGRWETQVGPNESWVSDAATKSGAYAALLEAIGFAPVYAVTLAPGRWPGTSLWLGDDCRLLINTNRLSIDQPIVVSGLSISVGDDGGESVQLALGRQPSTLPRELSDIAARLDRLERR